MLLTGGLLIAHPQTYRPHARYDLNVSRWDTIERNHPQFAHRCRQAFDANLHKVMATIRTDGSPRVSGTEIRFLEGDVWLGSMSRAFKLADLLRDPRLAIHCAPTDVSLGAGDAKLSGRALPAEATRWTELTGQPAPGEDSAFFTIDIGSLTLTHAESQELVIETWSENRGYRKLRRM